VRRLLFPLGLSALSIGCALIFFGPAASSATSAHAASAPAHASTVRLDDAGTSTMASAGRELFALNCSTCHGVNAQGSSLAPNLVGVGAATVDLWVSSGWMPLAVPTAQPIKKPDDFSRKQTLELAAYVQSLGGGPTIPEVNPAAGNQAQGFDLFSLNCAPCHTITGAGDALSNGLAAPSLHSVTATEIAEAVETGPGNMPRLSPGALTKAQVNDVISYIQHGIQKSNDSGGLALGGVGPVAEGFVGLFIGVGACMIAGLWIGDRSEPDEADHDEETPVHV
jgi:ubiquinol-cytochrome c reductase cytochrome c subunit